MNIQPIYTKVLMPPHEDLYAFLDTECPTLEETSVLLIASKLVAIHQGRCYDKTQDKHVLIEQESDHILDKETYLLTIKNQTFVPFGGIDESNTNGYLVPWPEKPFEEATRIHKYLCKKNSIQKLGIIIVDSTLLPMRKGTVGISIGHHGIAPIKNYVNTDDIFGRKMKLSACNVIDSLAGMAPLVMGEGKEQSPLALIKDIPSIVFSDEGTAEDLYIAPREDMFASIIYNSLKE